MGYHVTGFISALTFLLTLWGLGAQLRLVFARKRLAQAGHLGPEQPTAVLSLNQFVSSFLAFHSFLLYGACLPRFNHYLVWPRLAASLLTLWILEEMRRDRRDTPSRAAAVACLLLLLLTPGWIFVSPHLGEWGQQLAQALVAAVTLVLVQGYLHQVIVIRRSGLTGGVSKRMHQCFLLKDLSTLAFAAAMGWREGWPLFVLSTASAVTKVVTLWHFRWVRVRAEAGGRGSGGGTVANPDATKRTRLRAEGGLVD